VAVVVVAAAVGLCTTNMIFFCAPLLRSAMSPRSPSLSDLSASLSLAGSRPVTCDTTWETTKPRKQKRVRWSQG
jgi:hypothetical protein